jgi:hypothetical protein
MLVKKIALISILAVAVFIVGCSDKKSTNAQISTNFDQPTVTTPMDRPVPTGDLVNIDSNKRFSFVGVMHRSGDIEIDGCWYIRSLTGLEYVPIFEKDPDFFDGMYLNVYGYERAKSLANCIKSPYFTVEKYEIVTNGVDNGNQVTLTGRLLQMPDGDQCRYMITSENTNVELDFPSSMVNDPKNDFKYGSEIEIQGNLNVDVSSKCVDGPILRVVKYHYIVPSIQ